MTRHVMDARAQSCNSTVSAIAAFYALSSARAHRIRIIGGRYRGRIVRFPAASELRPTPDRVRETLFNWLGQDLTGRRTLDLYCGTGILSLEALSRGAVLAVAVDRNPILVHSVETVAASFGAVGLEARVADAQAFLAREARAFDVVFLDPPFETDLWPWLLPRAIARLAPGGFVYAEAGREILPPGGAFTWRHARAGQVHYHLMRADAPAEASTE
ncbi:MAG TPA: 16S rRNA (guanine(966)-N(2))-methyltransferase RsmD [Casimicrobiaceae bacterium]|jgi:16S rRNA (guanine966-N2)-methyltransferase